MLELQLIYELAGITLRSLWPPQGHGFLSSPFLALIIKIVVDSSDFLDFENSKYFSLLFPVFRFFKRQGGAVKTRALPLPSSIPLSVFN
jgi:hypothetical protein